jgi:hypothetical protein
MDDVLIGLRGMATITLSKMFAWPVVVTQPVRLHLVSSEAWGCGSDLCTASANKICTT